eukprot:3030109-Pyramimonas_sp.AAC.1
MAPRSRADAQEARSQGVSADQARAYAVVSPPHSSANRSAQHNSTPERTAILSSACALEQTIASKTSSFLHGRFKIQQPDGRG